MKAKVKKSQTKKTKMIKKKNKMIMTVPGIIKNLL